METEAIISLEEAKQQLTKLMDRLNKIQREHLLSYAIQEWMVVKIEDDESDEGSYTAENTLDDPIATLNSVAKEIKNKFPFDSVMASETLTQKSGSVSDVEKQVDAFLYTHEDLQDLVKNGKLNMCYCLDCGSKNVTPYLFTSHSTSREELYLIFNDLLPTLDGKTVLDIGSRLGAVLYGAYVYTDAKRIIGVEMNKEFCDLQKDIIRQFKMEKRVEVVNKRIEDAIDVLKSADVVVLNKVFDLYLSKSEQVAIWQSIRANVKKGAYIVCRPSIASVLSLLDTGIVIDEWVKLVDNSTQNSQFGVEFSKHNMDKSSEIVCYIVL